MHIRQTDTVLFRKDLNIPDGPDCDQCSGILEELENIDDDCDRHGIKFVKTQDYTIAESYGVTDFPVLVYFENNIPNVYEGNYRTYYSTYN